MKTGSVLAVAGIAVLLAVPPLVQGDGVARGRQCDEPFTDVLQRAHSGVEVEQVRVIEDEEEWCAFWDEVYSFMAPAPPCDTTMIDFNWEVAIVAALGERPDSCYGVGISCIQTLGVSDNLRVFVTETVPGEGCNCLPVVTHPVSVVKVDRPVKNVRFRKVLAELVCE